MKGHSKQPLISFENSEKLVSSEEVKEKVEDVAKQTGLKKDLKIRQHLLEHLLIV